MKQMLFIISLSFASAIANAQSVDTIIHTGIYTSYYSYTLKEPLYVTYTLYMGGGDCSLMNN